MTEKAKGRQNSHPSYEMKDDVKGVDEQLCFALYTASRSMTQLYRPLLAPLGLTYPQYLVMLVLWQDDGVTLRYIAETVGQKPGALTPVLKRMEQDGLLERERNQKDERQLKIRLTSKGRALRVDALKVNQCIFESCDMPVEELERLKQNIEKLTKSLIF